MTKDAVSSKTLSKLCIYRLNCIKKSVFKKRRKMSESNLNIENLDVSILASIVSFLCLSQLLNTENKDFSCLQTLSFCN